MPPEVSVLIVNWNSHEETCRCVKSVASHLNHVSHEIIVVDNASSDGSVAALEALKLPQLTVVLSTVNSGFVGGNNLAARHATGRYWLLLNSDTVMLSGQVASTLDYLDAHPEVAIAAGPLETGGGERAHPGRGFPSLWMVFFVNVIRRIYAVETAAYRRHLCRHLPLDEIAEVDWLTGAYLFVRASLVDGEPLLDERIFMYYEDTLLCMRAKRRGHSVRYLPDAPVVQHLHGVSARKARAATVRYCLNGSTVYVTERYGRAIAQAYRASVLGCWAVIGVACGILALLGGGSKLRTKQRLLFEALAVGR